MKIVSAESIATLIECHGFDRYITDLIDRLRTDFAKWDTYMKTPRPTMDVSGGVLELMPICNNEFYTFKYVTCHPNNPSHGRSTVYATGQLSRTDTGYPLMFSEMSLLTAFRTAAATALATDLMARKDANILAIIGTGAQSDFQVRATQLVRDISEVRYYDTDEVAMNRFQRNMEQQPFRLVRCSSAEDAVNGADIVTVCTACKAEVVVIEDAWVRPGMHINGLGGDCRGKTELDRSTLYRSRIFVEYIEQSTHEGEIQHLHPDEIKQLVRGELHELITGAKQGRTSEQDITLYDSVGIALEDFSALRLTYELANAYGIGEDRNLIPQLADPKDLISALG